MTGDQVRAARKLLNLNCFRLSQLSGVPESTISKFETTNMMLESTRKFEVGHDRVSRVRTALETAGVVFTDGENPKVTLREAPKFHLRETILDLH